MLKSSPPFTGDPVQWNSLLLVEGVAKATQPNTLLVQLNSLLLTEGVAKSTQLNSLLVEGMVKATQLNALIQLNSLLVEGVVKATQLNTLLVQLNGLLLAGGMVKTVQAEKLNSLLGGDRVQSLLRTGSEKGSRLSMSMGDQTMRISGTETGTVHHHTTTESGLHSTK